jgi:hypothetical protein
MVTVTLALTIAVLGACIDNTGYDKYYKALHKYKIK